ncbi:MAG: FAD-dependent oxidoreductase, partial [Rhodospirillaceae bacterium]|nr:FAD-dependent oxidoreductase [Rhodospirillaceae bacterium]
MANDGLRAGSGFRLSKRTLLKSAGAGALIGALPSVLPTWRRAEAADKKFDLIVIGAGTAGMPAAIFAAERGARVLVIEKSPVLGGTLDRTGGQMSASRTVFQKAKGIEDSPDAHFADNMRINNWTADPVMTRLFVDNAGDTLNWLAAQGFEVLPDHPVLGGGHEYFTTPRYQWGKDSGRSIFAVLEPLFEKAVAAGKVTAMLSTGAVDLIQDKSGAVVGVTVEDDAGRLSDHMGKHVLLACGGCAANPRMFEDLHGVPLTAAVAYPFSQGMGLTLGQAAGGYLRGGEKFLGSFGTVLADDNYPSVQDVGYVSRPDTRPPWEIYVNAAGERFMREDHPSVDYREHALLRQPGMRLWVIASQEMMDKAPTAIPRWGKDKVMAAFGTHPMFTRAESLEALAVKSGINVAGLTATVAKYNTALKEGGVDAFGRVHRPLAIGQGPYYAIRLTSYSLLSFAGLAIDGQLRVVRPDGTAIPNLYAAGEVIGAGATSGNAYTNGSMVTPALTFGRLLGQRMLKFNA